MKKHFVEFLSPGTFTSEVTEKAIDNWDVEQAKKMARNIKERHGATPYGFRFITRERKNTDLDSKVSKVSGIYYLGGKVETLAQVKARGRKDEEILICNMENNGYDKIIVNTNSYKSTFPLYKEDIVLSWP